MNGKKRAVLVGCGGISGAWLGSAKNIPELEIVGLVDIVAESAKKRAADFGLPQARIGTNLSRMLSAVKPDVVFDCTTPESHVKTTLTALRHGCHVLGEKPLADSMKNARRMVAAAQEAGKTYAVMQNRRYVPEICQVREFVASGALGTLTQVNSDFYIGAHFGGFRDVMQHVLLLDMAIHTFDAARMLMQADPVSVYCREWNPQGSWYKHGAAVVAVFEMTGGIVYTYRGSWCAEGMSTTWESDWRLIGDKGSLVWDGGAKMAAQVATKVGGFTSEFATPTLPPYAGDKPMGGHGGVIQDFVRCLQTGRTPETICTDNIKSLAMVFGAIKSAKLGKPVPVVF